MDIIDAFERRAGRALPFADALRQKIARRQLARCESLFNLGEAAPNIYLVRSGVLKLSYMSPEGKERVREFVAEHQVFACLEALSDDAPANYGAIACENCDVEYLAASDIETLAASELAWARCVGLFYLDTALNRGGRERQFLMLSPPDRLQMAMSERPWLTTRVSQQDLSAYIGITPVSLSRLKSRMRKTEAASSFG